MTPAIGLAGRIRRMRQQVLVVALTYATVVESQPSPAQIAAASDTPALRQRLEGFRTSAGSEWAEAFDFYCAVNPNRANRADDPEIEPTRVLDTSR